MLDLETTTEEYEMTDLRAKGATNKAKGQVEEGLGKLTGDRRQQAKGKVKQVQAAPSRAWPTSRTPTDGLRTADKQRMTRNPPATTWKARAIRPSSISSISTEESRYGHHRVDCPGSHRRLHHEHDHGRLGRRHCHDHSGHRRCPSSAATSPARSSESPT